MKNVNTKFVIILSCAIFLCAGHSMGQDQSGIRHKYFEFGIRFMPTFTALKLKSSDGNTISGEVNMGFGAGAFIGLNFTKHVGFQGEVMYSSITQKIKSVNDEQKINLKYINIPLLLSLNTGKSKVVNLNIVAGPQIGFNTGSSLSQSTDNDPGTPRPILSVKKSNFGLAYGAGLDIGLNSQRNLRLGLGYRGVLGLLDISDKSQSITTDSYYILDRTKVNTNSIYAGLSILF